MLEVVDLEIDRDVGEIGRPPRHADVVDIAVMLGDDLCNLCKRARLVHRLHGDARWKALGACSSSSQRTSSHRSGVSSNSLKAGDWIG